MHRQFVTCFRDVAIHIIIVSLSPCWQRFILRTTMLLWFSVLVKKYIKCSLWNLNNCFWRYNRVLSQSSHCTWTKLDTGLWTFWIVMTQLNTGCKTWNNDHHVLYMVSETAYNVHSPYDWQYKPLFNFCHFVPWQFSHKMWRNFFMNLTSVVIKSSETFS